MKPAITERMIQLYVLGVAPDWVDDAVSISAETDPTVREWVAKWTRIAQDSDSSSDDIIDQADSKEFSSSSIDELQARLAIEDAEFESQLENIVPFVLPWPTPEEFRRTGLESYHAADAGIQRSTIWISFVFPAASSGLGSTKAILSIPEKVDLSLDGLENGILVEVFGEPLTEPVMIIGDSNEVALRQWSDTTGKRQKFIIAAHDLRDLLGSEFSSRLIMMDANDRMAAGQTRLQD